MTNIVLGITGSIAAYKATEIVSSLKKAGHELKVIMTDSATKLIPPLTLQVLSKNQVHVDLFHEPEVKKVNHIELALWADVFLIAPATANIVGKIAGGIADDLLSTVVMAIPEKTPKLIAPAMNTRMYQNVIFQKNLKILTDVLHFREIKPRTSQLACGEVGIGALADISEIVRAVETVIKKG